MRPTIDHIKEAIKQEAVKHGLLQETVQCDIDPAIEIPGRPKTFSHTVQCKCGFLYTMITQHSARTAPGSAQFHQALNQEMTEHGVTAAAEAIYQLHEPTN